MPRKSPDDAATAMVLIEDFQPDHLPELVAMWRESFEHGVGITDPHSLEEQQQYFVDQVMPSNTVRVALLEHRIAAFVAASQRSISQLYVRKGLYRRGIGSRLLQWAKQQSAGSLWLYTFERNAVARAFYESHGFRIAARGFEPTWQLEDLRYEWDAGRAQNGG